MTSQSDEGMNQRLPLTGAQQGLWYAQQMAPDNPIFNVAQYVDIDGAVDVDKIRTAIETALADADAMHLRFGEDDDGPYQWMSPDQPQELRVIDLSGEDDPEASALRWMHDELSSSHRLDGDDLICIVLFVLSSERSVFYQRIHHLLADGYSTVLLLGRFAHIYGSLIDSEPMPPNPFGSFQSLLDDEREYLTSSKAEKDREFWTQRLDRAGDAVSLAARPQSMPFRLERATGALSAEVVGQVIEAIKDNGFAGPTAILAAVAAYLHRMTGHTEITIGLPVTARRKGTTMIVPSMLSNIVPLRVEVRPEMTLETLLRQVQSETRKILVHQRFRYEQLPKHSTTQRLVGPGVNILPVLSGLELGGVKAAVQNLSVGPVEDLSIIIHGFDPGNEVRIDLDGHPDLYDVTELHDHLDRLSNVFDAFAADLSTAVGNVTLLDTNEKDRQLEYGQGDDVRVHEDTVVEMFQRLVDLELDSTSVVAPDTSLSTCELDLRSNQLARYLRSLGAESGRTIALALPRTSLFPVAVLAVLKSGATLLPLDPAYPLGRLTAMVEDAEPVLLLTADGFDVPDHPQTVMLDADLTRGTIDQRSDRRIDESRPSDAAYVIYTSGSTGRPKGVAVAHRSLANLLTSHTATIFAGAEERLGRRVRMAHTAGFSFDASMDPILWMLAGHELHLIADEVRRDPEALTEQLINDAIDAIETTPSFAQALLDQGLLSDGGGPTVIALGGEAVSEKLWNELAANDAVAAFNFYGPTETTVDSMVAPIDAAHTPHIGDSVINSQHYLLDSGLQPVPQGTTGELYLSGAGVALGYLGRPGLSAERFISDPIASDGSRMYRTGDLARRQESGRLEFLGRTDDQVKIRGFRIEPGEIEAALTEHAEVKAAVVVVRGEHETARLLAYVTAADDSNSDHVSVDALREHVARQLPGYMVPAVIMVLPDFPMTPNGKLDRAVLPDPGPGNRIVGREPNGPDEQLLLELFAEVLGAEQVDVDDNFFELGGHSLLATRLIAAIRRERGTAPAIREVFEHPTPAQLADLLSADHKATPALVSRARPDILPLSYGQQRLWFLNRYDPSSAEYNIPVVLHLGGPLDHAALRGAFEDLVTRHETLRTIYPWSGDEPRQLVLDPGTDTVDLIMDHASPQHAAELMRAQAAAGFDLTRERPLRVRLYQTGPDEHLLLILMHHIAGDGWSLSPLAADLSAAYRARIDGRSGETNLADLPVQYADFALWQREVLGDENDPGSAAHDQVEFWRDTLADLPSELTLATDRPRPVDRDDRGGAVDVRISPEVHSALVKLAQGRNASVFMALQAGFAALLSRLGAGDDIPIGTAVAGRTESVLDQLVGFFVNTIVLRTDTSGDPSFAELVNRVRAANLKAYAHQDAPFDRVVEVLAPERSRSRHPLFQVMLTLQNNAPATLDLPGIVVNQPEGTEASTAKFDLLLDLSETFDSGGEPAGLTGSLQFSAALYDRPSVQSMVDRLVRLLEGLCADPHTPIGDIAVVSEAELALQDAASNGPVRSWGDETIIEHFLSQAQRTPDATALVCDNQRLTFTDLDRRVDLLARTLRAQGIRAGHRVAAMLPRSVESVIAILATLRSGGVFIPIDLSYPAERIEGMIQDCQPKLILAKSDSGRDFQWLDDITVVDPTMITADAIPAPLPDGWDTPLPLPQAEQLAYVIFTSGSTGRPKGVMVQHRSLTNLFHSHQEMLFPAVDASEPSRVAHISGIAFDAAWDPILWLIAGHELHMITDEVRLDAEALVDYCQTHHLDAIETTPSFVRQLLDLGLFAGDLHPRSVALGGEAVDADLWQQLAGLGDVTAYNLYGPTEFTVDSVMTSTRRHDQPVIGLPVANIAAHVLNPALRPVPTGAVGELYLAGTGMARGYLGRPDLTAERFVANPYDPTGSRMYRTGDLVSRTADGALRFIGRRDGQVKIRGFRVELGDIEAASRSCAGVAQAVVIVHGRAADQRLVGYITADGSSAGRVDDLAEQVRQSLAARLPSYMVPATINVLDRIPLTSNGKIDRRALPEPIFTLRQGRQARDEREETLCRLMAEALDLPEVGIDDDFFALGGHSLLAIRLIAQIRETFGTELQIRTLFRTPTVAGLALELSAGGEAQRALTAMPRPERVPLSYAQQRLWFLNRMDPGSPAYNIVLPVRLRGDVDSEALRRTVEALAARHETLRTVIGEHEGEPYQKILPTDQATPLFTVEAVASEGELRHRLEEISGTGFDLATDLPLRSVVLQLSHDEVVFVLIVHHIAADGGSIAPLVRDISTLYSASNTDTAALHVPLPVQYADYTLWQRENLGDESDPDSLLSRQLDFWENYLAGMEDESTLPSDRPRSDQTDHPAGLLSLSLDPALHQQLVQLARDHSTSVFATLQSGLAMLYTRLGAAQDIAFGSPVAGRLDRATDPLIGFFVNTVITRIDTTGRPSFAELLDRTRDSLLSVLDQQEVPFERMVDRMQPRRALGRHPLFQTMITMQQAPTAGLALPGLEASLEPEVSTGSAKFDLSFSFEERVDDTGAAAGISGSLEYDSSMYDEETITVLLDRLVSLLRSAVAKPGEPIFELDLLGATERRVVQLEAEGPHHDQQKDSIIDVLDHQVQLSPSATAVGDGRRQLDYEAVRIESDQVALALKTRGIGRSDLVAVLLGRSVNSVLALLGVLKSGAAFLPIDPTYPQARIGTMLDEAGAALTLVDDQTASLVTDQPCVRLDQLARIPTDTTMVMPHPRASDLAYVIYTSGTTGRPKGVQVTHGALANLWEHHQRTLFEPAAERAGRPLRMAHTTGVGFDAAWDPILWMLAGHALFIVSEDDRRDPQALAEVLRDERIDALETTPSFLRALQPTGALDRLRVIAVGGEAIDADLWSELATLDAMVRNYYGPTEVTVDSVIGEVSERWSPTIGQPVANTSAYVLDDDLGLVPDGAVGELYLSGSGLAQGYRFRADLTAERFVANPYGPEGSRMYRTGDLVRRANDTLLEYIGRSDDQVKIRGFRVELGEVRATLARHPGVEQAAVVVVGEDQPRLIGYVTGDDVDTDGVRQHAATVLPGYMVPSMIMALDALPLTPNGKLDTRALPEPEVVAVPAGANPRTPREEALCQLFAETLQLPRVGVDDNFFELGGHSLLATRMVARAGDVLGVPVTVQTLFQAPTPGQLLHRVLNEPDNPEDSLGRAVALRPSGSRPPLFCVHPASGLAWAFSVMLPLTEPEQPLYGLQGPGLTADDRERPPAANQAELADGYIAAMREIQPNGPYHLLGWSFGGNLAHIIATRLQQLGERVDLLAILDAYPAGQEHNADFGSDTQLWQALLDAVGYEATDDERGRLTVDLIREIYARNHDPISTLAPEMLMSLVESFEHTAMLLRDERPGRFDGDLLLFQATQDVPPGAAGPESWRDHVTGTITVEAVNERHSQLVTAGAMKSITPIVLNHLAGGTEL